jgi:hypothetical protein
MAGVADALAGVIICPGSQKGTALKGELLRL